MIVPHHGVNTATGSMAIVTAAVNGDSYKVTQGSDTFTFIANADGTGDASDNSIRFFIGSNTGTHVTNLVTEINAT